MKNQYGIETDPFAHIDYSCDELLKKEAEKEEIERGKRITNLFFIPIFVGILYWMSRKR